MSLTTPSWLRLVRDSMNRGCRCGCRSGHPAWIAVWLVASAVLVLSVPDQFEKTIRLTRGSIQRSDPDGLRHGGEVIPEVGATSVAPGDQIAQITRPVGSGSVGTTPVVLPSAVSLAFVVESDLLSVRPSSRRLSGRRPFLTPPTHAPPSSTLS